MTAGTGPVFVLRDRYQPESYWADEYLTGAVPLLEQLGWLARPLTDDDEAAVGGVLDGLHGLGLDETDVYPFGLLWALRATGAVRAVDGLDAQLADWREWEETDHVGEPMEFLPDLPNVEEATR